MQLHTLKPKTVRKRAKKVGRGGKRGTTSGKGSKGQQSRSGYSLKPGFRGADSKIWQSFPKLRGAGKKPGSKKPHRKHRFYRFRQEQYNIVNVDALNIFKSGSTVDVAALSERRMVPGYARAKVKILGRGELKNKLTISGMSVSKSAKEKIEKVGGSVQ